MIILNDKIFVYFIMDNKKILGGVLIFILFMLLFRKSRNSYTTTTTTVTKTINPNVAQRNVARRNINPYKAQYYN
jgi:hypothetical protein